MKARSFSLAELEWQQVDLRVKKQVISCVNMTVTRYRFGSAGYFPRHIHDQEQITYVIDGEIRFFVKGREYSLRSGGMIIISPDVPHSAKAGEQGADVLSIVSPARTGARSVRTLEEA